MTDDYEIVFEIEDKCEKELKKSDIRFEKYIDRIIGYSVTFHETGVEPHIHKLPTAIQSQLYFETTMYVMKLGMKERALVTIDADEIFDRLIITLWAFTANHDYERIFRRLSESMYQKFLNQGGVDNE